MANPPAKQQGRKRLAETGRGLGARIRNLKKAVPETITGTATSCRGKTRTA
jgi:Sec-independent protein translocase protein TatA